MTDIITTADPAQVIETTSATVVVVTTPGTDTVTDTDVSITIVTQDDAQTIATGSVILHGIADIAYPAKRLTYTDGEISEIRMYSDPAATQLAERRVITRAGGAVTRIDYFDGADTLLRTRTFTYSPDSVLTGVSDT